MPDETTLLSCPRCGDGNAPAALVCNGCGARLPRLNGSLVAEDAESEPAPESVEQTVPEAHHEDTAREIDSRRAHHMLERAFALCERREFDAAILSCRQALVLEPNYALGCAMLGLLLNRQGDKQGAAVAYARAEQALPTSDWLHTSYADLQRMFRSEVAATGAAPAPRTAPNVSTPPVPDLTETDAEALAAAKLNVELPRPAAPQPVVWEETVSPAKGGWLVYAAVGVVMFVAMAWLYKSFSPPTPVAPGSSAWRPGAPAPEAAAQIEPSSQDAPGGPPNGQMQPPPPLDGQNPPPPGPQRPPAGGVGPGQSPPPRMPPAAAPAGRIAVGAGATPRPQLTAPPVPARQPAPSVPAGALPPGAPAAAPPAQPVAQPTFDNRSSSGSPHSSIPGAFTPGGR